MANVRRYAVAIRRRRRRRGFIVVVGRIRYAQLPAYVLDLATALDLFQRCDDLASVNLHLRIVGLLGASLPGDLQLCLDQDYGGSTSKKVAFGTDYKTHSRQAIFG